MQKKGMGPDECDDYNCASGALSVVGCRFAGCGDGSGGNVAQTLLSVPVLGNTMIDNRATQRRRQLSDARRANAAPESRRTPRMRSNACTPPAGPVSERTPG